MNLRETRRLRRDRRQRLHITGISILLTVLITLVLVGTLSAQTGGEPPPVEDNPANGETGVPVNPPERNDNGEPEVVSPPDLSMDKQVDETMAQAGDTLAYTIIIANDGDSAAVDVVMTDTLPAELTYVEGSLSASGGIWGHTAGVITWTGSVMNADEVIITFDAEIDGGTPAGTMIDNTAGATWNGNSYSDSTTTTVVEDSGITGTSYLPIIFAPPPDPPGTPTLAVSRPTFENTWVTSWNNPGGGVTGYELQESFSPDFSNPVTYNPGTATSAQIQHELGINNEYYYRIRALNPYGESDWSNSVMVISGYRDGFDTSINNWGIRRTTFIEEVTTFHEIRDGNGLLILRVEDSWDWGIVSPMVQAPSPPYQIEYRTQIANFGNLVSHGLAFGADWPGPICPDWSSLPGVYEHSLCFNHFYLPNVIWYGPMKMQFERVDFLVWCPNCGGSPMKRLSDDYSKWFLVDPINHAVPDGWNTWRVEVRNDGLKMFVNNQQYAVSDDTRWVNEPYFGVFGSTDEYSNSTYRWDWVEVRPLDN